METTVIVALVGLGGTVVGSIITALFQFRLTKAQAKKIEIEPSTMLLDRALSINKQDMDNLRGVNKDLIDLIKLKDSQLKELVEENTLLQMQLDEERNKRMKLEQDIADCLKWTREKE